MGSPIIRPAIGVVNGSNVNFRTPSPYVTGSVVLYLNGVSRVQSADDGWTEEGSDKVKMKEAPVTGDVVQVYYLRQ